MPWEVRGQRPLHLVPLQVPKSVSCLYPPPPDQYSELSPVPFPNGYRFCAFRCKDFYRDCNLVPEDGCEKSVETDVLNCGLCGNACPSPPPNAQTTCTSGVCGYSCLTGFADC